MAINPITLLAIGVISGIGGAVTYTAFHYAEEGTKTMTTQKQSENLKAMREASRIYKPPLMNLERNEGVKKLLPMPPKEGPPLPRILALRWPWKK